MWNASAVKIYPTSLEADKPSEKKQKGCEKNGPEWPMKVVVDI